MAGMEALGRLIDGMVGVIPADMNAAAYTGKWVSMKRNSGLSVVFIHAKGAAGAGDPTLTLQEATSSAGAGAQNLATIDHYYRKSAAALAGSELWTEVTQVAAATIVAAAGEGAADEAIWVFDVLGEDLSAGFSYINVSTAKVTGTSTPELGTVLYLPHDLLSERDPVNLAAANA